MIETCIIHVWFGFWYIRNPCTIENKYNCNGNYLKYSQVLSANILQEISKQYELFCIVITLLELCLEEIVLIFCKDLFIGMFTIHMNEP